MLPKFSARQGSRAWDRIVAAWQKLVPNIELTPPCNGDKVLATNVWWSTTYFGMEFGFSHYRAAKLM
jgi:hypothetical protein